MSDKLAAVRQGRCADCHSQLEDTIMREAKRTYRLGVTRRSDGKVVAIGATYATQALALAALLLTNYKARTHWQPEATSLLTYHRGVRTVSALQS